MKIPENGSFVVTRDTGGGNVITYFFTWKGKTLMWNRPGGSQVPFNPAAFDNYNITVIPVVTKKELSKLADLAEQILYGSYTPGVDDRHLLNGLKQ